MSEHMEPTPEQQEALAQLTLRLREWDEYGGGSFSAVDFAVAARAVVAAFNVGPAEVSAEEEEDDGVCASCGSDLGFLDYCSNCGELS